MSSPAKTSDSSLLGRAPPACNSSKRQVTKTSRLYWWWFSLHNCAGCLEAALILIYILVANVKRAPCLGEAHLAAPVYALHYSNAIGSLLEMESWCGTHLVDRQFWTFPRETYGLIRQDRSGQRGKVAPWAPRQVSGKGRRKARHLYSQVNNTPIKSHTASH